MEINFKKTNKQTSSETIYLLQSMCFGKLIKNELFKVYPYFYKIRDTIDNF